MRLLARWRPRASVLVYHRVASPALDPWSLAVTPEHFAEHVQVLARHATVVPLSALPAVVARRRAPRRCVAVTFDDGYADNLHAAVPSLERGEVPATVFVVAGALGGAELWWDRLARLLLSPGELPDRLTLSIGGVRHEWSFGTDGARQDASEAERHLAWRAGTEPPTTRHAAFAEIWRRLQPLPRHEQDRLLGAIDAWAGGNRGVIDTRMLTEDELGTLGAHPLVDIGGHTLSHPRLSALDAADQEREIVEGKRVLEAVVGRALSAFAYPFGRPDDFTADTVLRVQRAGFRLACANFSGTVDRSTDLFRLPRAYVHDCDGEAFERRLVEWLGAPSR